MGYKKRKNKKTRGYLGKSRRFSGRSGRRIYIKYMLMLAAVLGVCILLDNYVKKQAVPETNGQNGDYVQIQELAGYLQVIPLAPEETRMLIVEPLEVTDSPDADETTAENPGTGETDLSDTGTDHPDYLTAADIRWLFDYLALGEMPEAVSLELDAVGDGYVPRGTWCAIYEEILAILSMADEVEVMEIQYLGMLLEDGHLMADSGNYECDTEGIDFVYGETYRVYVWGNVLLGRALSENVDGADESRENLGEEDESEDAVALLVPETVRVLITQDNDRNIYRENVYVKGDGELQISIPQGEGENVGEVNATIAAGTVVDCLAWMEEHDVREMTVSFADSDASVADAGESSDNKENALTDGSGFLASGRLSLTDSGGTALASGYTGVFHIYRDENGLRVVNETSLEAYLCGVVPGEMPESFDAEALKAQAVCARTYAARLVSGQKYEEYGADLNDTTDCQVYLPSAENEKSTEAVSTTKGQVLTYEGGLADIYYFSTSCGLTSGLEVWQLESPAYLQTVSLLAEMSADASASSGDSTQTESAFGDKSSFDDFIRQTDISAYDSHSRYFRWMATLDMENCLAELKSVLQTEIAKGTGHIGVEDTSGAGVSSVENLGVFSGMEIISRNEAGMVTDLALAFENGCVHIYHENTIRTVLGVAMTALTDKNGETVDTMTMLPSAAFSVESADGQIRLYGGGLGHGIGMSQYGADGMAQAGMGYAEILSTFFPETRILEK